MYLITVTSKCRAIKEVEVTITEQGINDKSYYCQWSETRTVDDLDIYELQELQGYKLDTDFVEYIDNDLLRQKLLTGYLRLDIQDDELVAIIEYKAIKRLSKAELDELKDYTEGQLADGIGEGFEQELVYNKYYVSTWVRNSNITIKQTKINA